MTTALSDLNHLLDALQPLLVLAADREEGPEPEDVKAGWTGFAVFLGLIVATGLLLWSMTRHVRNVRRDQDAEQDHGPDLDDLDEGGDRGDRGTPGVRDV
ncbi:hypothetical protein RDV89_14845 [Nocardioides zeae]|uniref:Uncharacterized protein n=1 Tax=Nocardioides imazamoxiresistens TaxID=3231893 RepID=A0ABU3Q030_9ACTN|nr:hypothetical protein [Nocardioides zeae]MDT9594360.1 hypothetical protein [Nocardioides zeae]